MRVVFVTHNDLGLACLEELVSLDADIAAIYTRPAHEEIADQADLAGFADQHSIPIHRVESINKPSVKGQLREYEPQLLFVVGWSRLVDQEVIDIPLVTALGMHPAPLPRGRGRAPIAWSLIKGLDETALSFFHLAEEADAGDIVGQEPISIDPQDDAGTLYEKVVDTGRTLIRRYYPSLEGGSVPRTPQDESDATWWPKREPQHGLIDWTRPPEEVHNWIRGQSRPYPGAFSFIDGQKVTIWAANPPSGKRQFVEPGEIAYRDGEVLGVGAWEGTLEISEVQLGEKPEPASHLVTEHGYDVGTVFDNARERLE